VGEEEKPKVKKKGTEVKEVGNTGQTDASEA
jgi:hypothetical protein